MSGAADVRIITYDPAYARAFADLNYRWIEQFFTVEQHDSEMLENPGEYIIDAGGEIFFAIADEIAVGTAALISDAKGEFELAKMAVSPEYRGRGIGDMLIDAAVEYSRAKGKDSIYLLSNTVLKPAIGLYRKHGFVETPMIDESPYQRTNIRMQLALHTSRL